MKNKKIINILAILFVGITFLNACTVQKVKVKKTIEEKNDYRDYITMNLPAEPLDLNPQTSQDLNSKQVISQIYQGLFYTENDKIKKGIVDEYGISDDKRLYKFKLKDTKWSDGKKMTALDIKNSWIQVLNPENAIINRDELYIISGAEEYSNGLLEESDVKIKVIDDLNLEVELKSSDENFIARLAKLVYYPYRNKDTFSGPFKLTDWIHHQEITLEKNSKYWNSKKVNLNKVVIKLMTGEIKPINEFAKGNIDLTTISRKELYRYKGSHVLKNIPSNTTFSIMFNLESELMNSEDLRASIENKFPFDIFESEILNDFSGKVSSFFKDEIIEKFQNSGEKKSYLSNSESKVKILSKNQDVPLKIATILQQIVGNMNIQVEVENAVDGQYYDRLSNSNFDLAIAELDTNKLYRESFYQNFYSNGYYNYYGIKNLDGVLKEKNAVDIQKEIDKQNYAIAISHGMRHYLFSEKFTNLRFINDGIIFIENVDYAKID